MILEYVPAEITIASFSIIGLLSGYIWNNNAKRLSNIEKEIQKCPFPDMKSDIGQMKKDIEWIKKYLDKLN